MSNKTYDIQLTLAQVMNFCVRAEANEGTTVTDKADISVVWKMFNPMTDSKVILELDFIHNEGTGMYALESQLRDHDGEGENIPHSVVEYYHSDEECSQEYLIASIAKYELVSYVREQEDIYTRGVERNAKAIGGTALLHAFQKALKQQ